MRVELILPRRQFNAVTQHQIDCDTLMANIAELLRKIAKVINKLYEDNALGNIDQDRYGQLFQKYSEEHYLLKKELAEAQEHISDRESASGQAKKFIKLVESYCDFNDLTPTAINEFVKKM